MSSETNTATTGIFGKPRAEIEAAIKDYEQIRCPLCDLEPKPFAVDYQGFQLCSCPECGMEFLNPRPVFFELLDTVYNEAYLDKEGANFEPDEFERRYFEGQLDTYEELLGRKGKILDVGCGRGTFLATARSRGWEIYGADVRLAPNAKRLGCPVWESTLDKIDFEGVKFDLIRFNHVLEHTQNPLKELVQTHDLLVPNGLLHVSVPNLAGIGSRLKSLQSKFGLKGKRWRHYAALHHLFFFAPSTLVLFVQKAGFRVLRITTPVVGKNGQGKLLEWIYKNSLERFKTANILDVYCTPNRK